MSSPTRDWGQFWEDEAARYLSRHGLAVVERGYRCRLGEIDLICRDGSTLVIVEVRARSSRGFGGALASVDTSKRRKLVRTARHYLMRHPHLSRETMRFDVVAIEDAKSAQPSLTWIRNAFDE